MKTIGILTSSRADFGIYLPLLKKLKQSDTYSIKIIAFGTHLSTFHGYTISNIQDAGFDVDYTVESIMLTDSPASISSSIGLTTLKFADFWKNNGDVFDLIFCLGDRYEMFAAVISGIPFQLTFAHLHGGETTLGAIDNVFRHAITLASKYHFVSTEIYKKKVETITGSVDNVFNVGALSLDNLSSQPMLTLENFREKWGIDLSKPTILVTFHPETVNFDKNKFYVEELVTTINALNNYQILITLPNNDTVGNVIREVLIKNYSKSERVFLIENLGTESYFTAMANCAFLMGNTSSGIIEAMSFHKYVINLGDRQKGRLVGPNVLHTKIEHTDILKAIININSLPPLHTGNIYYNNGASDGIMKALSEIINTTKNDIRL